VQQESSQTARICLIFPQNHQTSPALSVSAFHSSKHVHCNSCSDLMIAELIGNWVYEVFHRIAISAFMSLRLQLNCNVCSHFFMFAIEMQMIACMPEDSDVVF
jgi:ribosomal protein S27E